MNDTIKLIEKMQGNINVLQNEIEVLKQHPSATEGIYEIFPMLFPQSKTNKKFVDYSKIGFPVLKYCIDETQSRANKFEHFLNKNLEINILNLIASAFNSEDFVVIISNSSHYNRIDKTNILIFKLLAKNKIGKITNNNDAEDKLTKEYSLHSLVNDGKEKITASIKCSYLDVLNYYGYPLENENIILLNEEFGYKDALTNLLIELKPKKLLNLIFNNRNNWFDSVD